MVRRHRAESSRAGDNWVRRLNLRNEAVGGTRFGSDLEARLRNRDSIRESRSKDGKSGCGETRTFGCSCDLDGKPMEIIS
jgi:hypothetical protein